MGMNSRGIEKTGELAAESQGSGAPTGFENVKNIIADRLLDVADAMADRAAAPDARSGKARCEKHASEWLGHSAEYVRRNPGRSLLIAGAAGLVVGVLLRRR